MRIFTLASLTFLSTFSLLAQSRDSLASADSLRLSASVYRIDGTTIRNQPMRELTQFILFAPGVVQVNNELHVRGSRSYETGYSLDGFGTVNPFFGANGVLLIPEAIEEIDVHTGTLTASQGSMMGGLIATKMRTGGEVMEYSLDLQTDDLVHPGNRFLNTTPRGYKNIVGTISGPIPVPQTDSRFFLAGQHTYLRNRQTMFLEPFSYDSLTEDGLWSPSNLGRPLPGPVKFSQDWLPDNWFKATTLQGNLTSTIAGFHLKILGSYNEQDQIVGSEWPSVLRGYYHQQRNMLNRITTKFGGGEIRYDFGSHLTTRASVSLYDRYERTFDRDFGHNWFSYPDSAANARYYDTSGWLSRYSGPNLYSTIWAFFFIDPVAPNNTYSKNRQTKFSLTVDVQLRPTEQLDIAIGGIFDSWTMRKFNVNNISYLRSFLDRNRDGIQDATFASAYEKRIRYLDYGSITSYGYTYLGIETDGYEESGGPEGAILDKPYLPVFGSIYCLASFRSSDLLLDLGLRYEYFDPRFKAVRSGPGPLGQYDVPYDNALGIMDEGEIGSSEARSLLLPRVNLRFRPSDQTSFFAGFGVFAQMPPLDLFYVSNLGFSHSIAPEDRSPYSGSIAFDVRPERSKHYEFGLEHRLTTGVSIAATAYYKVLPNQVQLAWYFDPSGIRPRSLSWPPNVPLPLFTQFRNDGNGFAKGIEIRVLLNHSMNVSAEVTYALSVAKGTTSQPRSNAAFVGDFSSNFLEDHGHPVLLPVSPLDYEQRHRLMLIVDAKTDQDDGTLLGGWNGTAVVSLSSGHPYTRENGYHPLGVSMRLWTKGVFTIFDPRFSDPLEPRNVSTTPPIFNIDLRISKSITLGDLSIILHADVLNVLNTKNIVNVYPTTGTANDDSYWESPYANFDRQIPNCESFYRDINLKNRWAYMQTGNDLYGQPRQIRVGATVRF